MDFGDVLLQQIINGVSLGAMYALLALGFTMVYGIIELINFAHFNVFMVGSFVGLWAFQAMGFSGQSEVLYGLPLIGVLVVGLVVVMLATGFLGVAIERIALRPLRGVSGTARAVPDVSLEADTSPGNLVAKGGGWYAVGGTSDAAPQLAGIFTALNAAKGAQGNGGARLNALCGGSSFHDVTSGSNGGFSAVAGFDRVTGVGTVNEGNLITNW